MSFPKSMSYLEMFKPNMDDVTLVKKEDAELVDLQFHEGLQLYTPISPVSPWETPDYHKDDLQFPYEDAEHLLEEQFLSEMALPSLVLEPSGSISPDLVSNPTTPQSTYIDDFQTDGLTDGFEFKPQDLNLLDIVNKMETKIEPRAVLKSQSHRRARSEECELRPSSLAPPARTSRRNTDSAITRNRCSICDKQFKRPSSLRTHMYSHTGEKPFKCDWHACGRVFSVRSNMVRHYKIHEKGARRLKTDDSRKLYKQTE